MSQFVRALKGPRLGALTYKAGPRLVLDAGLRFGLNPEAPRAGLFAGLTVGVGGSAK